MGVCGGSTGVILRANSKSLVETTGEPKETNCFCQNLAAAVQRGNAFSNGSQLYPTPQFVPEGISSSVRDFIFFSLFQKIKSVKKCGSYELNKESKN